MEKQIQVTVELNIVAGKTSEVKQQIPALVQMVKMTELECISYEWFFNEEKNKCYILEGFRNSEALLAHLINVGPHYPLYLPMHQLPAGKYLVTYQRK